MVCVLNYWTVMSNFDAHPVRSASGLRLYGRRTLLRPLVASDFADWSAVRRRNHEWLTVWEPQKIKHAPDPETDREAFAARCSIRDRERQNGTAFTFGLFINQTFAGEVNLNSVQRGALMCGTIGYWIDQAHAGQAYIAEGVVVASRYAFENLGLHRLEICIVPRNENSRRVMEKLKIRHEGTALRFLEINGIWEDHDRYAMTTEEWLERHQELTTAWL